MLGPVYFYAIVGGGLAGLQLALRLKEDVFFKGKKIAIIDPSFKITRDKNIIYSSSRVYQLHK